MTFKNAGKSAIGLEHPTLDGYVTQQPQLTGIAKYIDPADFAANGQPLFPHRILTTEEFSEHYPPDVGDTVTMTTLMRRKPGSIALFHMTFREIREPRTWLSRILLIKPDELHVWSDYQWDYVCGESTDQNKRAARTRNEN